MKSLNFAGIYQYCQLSLPDPNPYEQMVPLSAVKYWVHPSGALEILLHSIWDTLIYKKKNIYST